MTNIQTTLLKIGLALAFVAGVFGYGVHYGTVSQIEKQAEEKAALQLELFDLGEVISVKNAELLRLMAEKEDLIDELETEAVEAPGASNPGVAANGGLQRLERRWGSSTSTP